MKVSSTRRTFLLSVPANTLRYSTFPAAPYDFHRHFVLGTWQLCTDGRSTRTVQRLTLCAMTQPIVGWLAGPLFLHHERNWDAASQLESHTTCVLRMRTKIAPRPFFARALRPRPGPAPFRPRVILRRHRQMSSKRNQSRQTTAGSAGAHTPSAAPLGRIRSSCSCSLCWPGPLGNARGKSCLATPVCPDPHGVLSSPRRANSLNHRP